MTVLRLTEYLENAASSCSTSKEMYKRNIIKYVSHSSDFFEANRGPECGYDYWNVPLMTIKRLSRISFSWSKPCSFHLCWVAPAGVGKANVFRMWLGRKTVNCQMKRRHFGPENRYDARIALSSRRPKLSFYMYAMFYVFDVEHPRPKHICSFLLFHCASTTALRLIDLARSFVDMARILNHTKTRTPSQQIQGEMADERSFTHSFLGEVPNKNIIRHGQSHGHIPIESRSM